jgi:DNA-binding MarR family transcriptional regulator
MNERLENIKLSFGTLFFVANRMETLIDRYLSPYNLTTKQFFLSIVLIRAKEENKQLTLSQASELMGTSRQNVKQLALKLQERGFCKITRDKEDHRILRLSITKKNMEFWEVIDSENIKFLNNMFKEIEDEKLSSMAIGLKKLYDSIEKLEKKQSS